MVTKTDGSFHPATWRKHMFLTEAEDWSGKGCEKLNGNSSNFVRNGARISGIVQIM